MQNELDALHAPVPPDLDALRYRVIGAAYRVHTALGPAMKETMYQTCLAHALRNEGLRVEEEVGVDVEFEGLLLPRALRMDIVVEGTIVLEIKASDTPLAVWNAQMLSYLWHTGLPLGYVINFHVARLKNGIKPFINIPEGQA